jgi:HD-GYP domain-containing protein (c-di-GMP phosphodiesterase class II)
VITEAKETFRVDLRDLVLCLSRAMDLVSPAVAEHHRRVACLATMLARELGFPADETQELATAAALHDAGALSLRERLETLRFELDSPWKHSELGYRLLKTFKPFAGVAPLVRYHHLPWSDGRGASHEGLPVPRGSHLLHLADRVTVLVKGRGNILGQTRRIRCLIEEGAGRKFVPEHVEAFRALSEKESLWFDFSYGSPAQTETEASTPASFDLDLAGLESLGRLISHIIDFRSRFTATHSSGVAATAGVLAGLCGFSEERCLMMRVAGRLHDLGKLAVPAEMINKPSKLFRSEFNVMKSHTFYTYRILEPLGELHTINTWASYHHERMDGRGYPFRVGAEELSLGSRIMAAADVFTALTEDRPYRKGLPRERVTRVLRQMARSEKLDTGVVSTLLERYDQMDAARREAQREAEAEYDAFMQGI